MKRSLQLFLAFVLLITAGCGKMKESYDMSEQTANDFHNKDAEALCSNFTQEMLDVMPCDVTKRVLDQTIAKVGEPIGECGWSWTYNITSFDPFRAVSIYKCPFEKETVKLTVVVDVMNDGAKISGLWADSSILRKSPMLLRVKLCENISGNKCDGEVERIVWDMEKIYVANSWQNTKPGDKITWTWYTPDGDEVTNLTHNISGKHDPYYSWSYIEPSYYDKVQPYGMWKVVTKMNGIEADILEFEVFEY
jgi:hypothetical protein